MIVRVYIRYIHFKLNQTSRKSQSNQNCVNVKRHYAFFPNTLCITSIYSQTVSVTTINFGPSSPTISVWFNRSYTLDVFTHRTRSYAHVPVIHTWIHYPYSCIYTSACTHTYINSAISSCWQTLEPFLQSSIATRTRQVFLFIRVFTTDPAC